MSKLLEAFKKNPLTLIVSLPQNSASLAKAAIDGGADALEAHINVEGFGNFLEERVALEDILDVADIPVGIVPGGKLHASQDEMEELKKMGFDFFTMHMKDIPPWMLQFKGMAKIAALDERYTIDKLMGLGSLGINAIEAAIIPLPGYGRELQVGDLQHYITFSISSEISVIIPTQRAIKPSDVPVIHDTGAKGLMVREVVTGKTAASIKKATREFRIAIDDLGA